MNLDCPELIADYLKRAIKLVEPSEPQSIDSNKRSTRNSVDPEEPVPESPKKVKRTNDFGYGRGLEIEKVLGATDVYGELMFLYEFIFF
jgi:hypothetical protein